METKRFKISSSVYVSNIFRPLLLNWLGIALCILFIPILILSFYDIRYFLVLLMLIFLVIPMLLFFVYIIHGFKAESRFSILEKSIEICPDKFVLNFEEDSREAININEVYDYRLTKNNLVLYCKRKDKYILIIERTSFKSKKDENATINIIENHIYSEIKK